MAHCSVSMRPPTPTRVCVALRLAVHADLAHRLASSSSLVNSAPPSP
jgi:hypothetical protein